MLNSFFCLRSLGCDPRNYCYVANFAFSAPPSPRRLLRAAFSAPKWSTLMLIAAASLLLMVAPAAPVHADWTPTTSEWLQADYAYGNSAKPGSVAHASVSANGAFADTDASGTVPAGTRGGPTPTTSATAYGRKHFVKRFGWQGAEVPTQMTFTVNGSVHAGGTNCGQGTSARAYDLYGGSAGAYGDNHSPAIPLPNNGSYTISADSGHPALIEIGFDMDSSADGRLYGEGYSFSSFGKVAITYTVQ